MVVDRLNENPDLVCAIPGIDPPIVKHAVVRDPSDPLYDPRTPVGNWEIHKVLTAHDASCYW